MVRLALLTLACLLPGCVSPQHVPNVLEDFHLAGVDGHLTYVRSPAQRYLTRTWPVEFSQGGRNGVEVGMTVRFDYNPSQPEPLPRCLEPVKPPIVEPAMVTYPKRKNPCEPSP